MLPAPHPLTLIVAAYWRLPPAIDEKGLFACHLFMSLPYNENPPVVDGSCGETLFLALDPTCLVSLAAPRSVQWFRNSFLAFTGTPAGTPSVFLGEAHI